MDSPVIRDSASTLRSAWARNSSISRRLALLSALPMRANCSNSSVLTLAFDMGSGRGMMRYYSSIRFNTRVTIADPGVDRQRFGAGRRPTQTDAFRSWTAFC